MGHIHKWSLTYCFNKVFSSATLCRLSRSARTIFSPPLRKTPSGDTRATSACSEQRGNQGTRTHAHTNNADSFGCPLCFCLYLPCSSFMHDWSARFFWESGACPCTFSQTVFELVYGGQCPRKRGAFISFSLITIGRTSLCLLPAVFCARYLR